jgi:hypothetical protein
MQMLSTVDPVAKSHFHAIWLLSLNYGIEEVAEILSFSVRGLRLAGQTPQRAGAGQSRQPAAQQRDSASDPHKEALAVLKERLEMPPDNGRIWTGPKVARWLA